MLSFLRLALLAAFVDGFGHYPADTHLDDCESDICWSGAACNWEPSGYRCECGMNGPLEYGHELSKSFEFSGDDSQFIKIDATFYAGGTRTGENDVPVPVQRRRVVRRLRPRHGVGRGHLFGLP